MTQGFVKEGALGATETTETDLGDIEITAKDVRAIVAIAGQATIETTTAGEGTTGKFRITSTVTNGTFEFPVTIVQGAAGTLAGIGPAQAPQWIPVNIPIVAKDTIGCYMTLNKAQTGDCRGQVAIMTE